MVSSPPTFHSQPPLDPHDVVISYPRAVSAQAPQAWAIVNPHLCLPMAPRAKGEAAAAKAKNPPPEAKNPPPDVVADKNESPLTYAITVPEDDTAASEATTQTPSKKPKKAEKDKADEGEKKPLRGKAALKAYWEDLARLAPEIPMDTWKKAIEQIKKVAIVQINKTGSFKIHGVCEFCVRQRKGREAKKSLLSGRRSQ